jgi:hypothetical protein
MRFVIYDDETVEPITVVDLPGFGERDIERLGCRILLSPQPDFSLSRAEPSSDFMPLKVVEVRFEQFQRRGVLAWMAFTRETELAMLLDPSWLPGQRPAIARMRDENDGLMRLLMLALSN